MKSVEAARKAFPDVKPKIIAEIAEDDWVAIAVYADGGKHQGTYMGIPATGRHVTWTETHFWGVVDGNIKEHFGNVPELHFRVNFSPFSNAFRCFQQAPSARPRRFGNWHEHCYFLS